MTESLQCSVSNDHDGLALKMTIEEVCLKGLVVVVGIPYGVQVKLLDCNIVVRKFEL